MPRRRVGRPGLVGTMARTAVVAGTATAVSGGMRNRSASQQQQAADADAYQQMQQQAALDAQVQAAAAQAAVAPAAPAAAPADDPVAKLKELASLHASGVLSDEEFAAMKAKVLAG
ncbi:MAG: SHOCT domain-containing protein [Jiangellales bacterium]